MKKQPTKKRDYKNGCSNCGTLNEYHDLEQHKGGETLEYLESIKGTADDPGE